MGKRGSGLEAMGKGWVHAGTGAGHSARGTVVRRSASLASSAARAGALGQVAFGQALQPPGHASQQPSAVLDGGSLAEQLGIAGAQLLHGQPRQGGNGCRRGHVVLLAPGANSASSRVDTEPRNWHDLKAIHRGIVENSSALKRVKAPLC